MKSSSLALLFLVISIILVVICNGTEVKEASSKSNITSSLPDASSLSAKSEPDDSSSETSIKPASSSSKAPPANSSLDNDSSSSKITSSSTGYVVANVTTETGYYAAYGSSSFLNFVVPSFILLCVCGAFYARLRVLQMGRAGLPDFMWNILSYLPSCLSCSPSSTGIGARQYNAVATQGDDTVSMGDMTSYDVDPPAVTTLSVDRNKKGMQLSAPQPTTADTTVAQGDVIDADGGDAAAVMTVPGDSSSSKDAASTASEMTSPFTMKFAEDDDDDGAWKTF